MNSIEGGNRQEFMKLGGIGLAALAASGAGWYAYSEHERAKLEPYALSPEKTGAGCGIAVIDPIPFSADVEIYIPKNDSAALDHGAVFSGTNENTNNDEGIIARASYGIGKIGFWPSDREARRNILSQELLVYDIRLQIPHHSGRMLIRVGASAPSMRGDYPDYDLPYNADVFTLAVGVQRLHEFILHPSPLCANESSSHVVDLLQGVAGRIDVESIFRSDDQILACTVIPQTFFPHADDALRNGSQIENVAQEVAQLASQLQYPIEQMYIPVRDVNGQAITGAQLPLGVACDLLALHQTSSGQMLALVKPRGYSFVNYVPGYESLWDNAAKEITPIPVWVDVMDVHAEHSQETVAATQDRQIQIQNTLQEQGIPESFGTPTANILDRAVSGSLPTATPAIPPTATEVWMSPTPMPSLTPEPTHTSAPDLSRWNIIEASITPTPAGAAPENASHALDVILAIESILCVSAPVLIGGFIYNEIQKAKTIQDEALAAKASREKLDKLYADHANESSQMSIAQEENISEVHENDLGGDALL